ncbi:hypothetical protein HBI56_006440 [Parastagonospora nodorum]|nr:hypothetical protein HBH51_038360 [Parastagonospora nodorum]KAH4207973.1 hypothetical protein HBI95_097850 [Parastagonospora nodorum]KAH4234780.1 hypothetical protein HBI06_055000 [Parastagonospora nodorum]KAH4249580.1 hypothetical protein HBI05_007230 [Parastagonospora nodorum]KAH4823111.1 hypothetical protein HBH61_007130 [Parastagonospora nodorum]
MRSHIANHSSRIAARFLQVDDATATMTNIHWNPFRRHALGGIVEETAGSARATPAPKSKTWETTVDRVPSWPEEARPLKKHTWVVYLYAIADVLLVLLPVYFILLGVATAVLHKKPTQGNALGTKVEFAMSLGPTMFPIVFAAIIGRSMKMIARFLAEKGAKLGTLELMMASQSVWGTVESQFLMQRFTTVGANLLFLWALSPLGGQASLRLMQRDQDAIYDSSKLRYLTTGPGGAMFSRATSTYQRGKFAEAGALYNAALLAPQAIKTGRQDSWGNVKIPRYETLDFSTMSADGWLGAPSTVEVPETYTALVGLPIAGLTDTVESNFTVEYNYVYVNCSPIEQEAYPGTHGTGDSTATNYTKLDLLLPGQVWYNKSQSDLQPFDLLGGRASFLLDTPRHLASQFIRNTQSRAGPEDEILTGRLDEFIGHHNQSRINQTEINRPRELTFASVYGISRDGSEQGLNIARCLLYQQHVEALVLCTGSQCVATHLRKSTTDKRPNTLTAFEDFVVFDSFAREFPTAIKFNEGSSPTELFMANTSIFPFVQKAGRQFADQLYTDLSKVPADVFSRRLSLVLNTYWQLTTQSSGYFGGLTNNLSAYGPDTLPVTDANVYLPANLSATEHTFDDWFVKFMQNVAFLDSPFLGATTPARTKREREIFICNFAWLALLLSSSTVILITGSMALILKRKTLGPEMFGFVSSMTYENPWVKIPQGGTMLDAMERTRLLKDVEVHVGDVRGQDDIGHIAFATGHPVSKLQRGRLYR